MFFPSSPSVAPSRRFTFNPLKIVERLRRTPTLTQPAAAPRPLLLSPKFPAPYNPLAAIDARQAAAAAPVPVERAELTPTGPVFVVSTSTSFHSLSSIDDVITVLKTSNSTVPAVDPLLLTPTPARMRTSTRKARRVAKAPIQPPHYPALVNDEQCPRTPRLVQDPFLQCCYRAVKKAAPPPPPAPTTPLPSTPVSSADQVQFPLVGPREPLLIPMDSADAVRFYAQKAALIAEAA